MVMATESYHCRVSSAGIGHNPCNLDARPLLTATNSIIGHRNASDESRPDSSGADDETTVEPEQGNGDFSSASI